MSCSPTTFYDRLRQLLAEHGVRQVARESRIRRRTLQRLQREENGHDPSVYTVEAIATACGVRPAWLLWGDGPRHEGPTPNDFTQDHTR